MTLIFLMMFMFIYLFFCCYNYGLKLLFLFYGNLLKAYELI